MWKLIWILFGCLCMQTAAAADPEGALLVMEHKVHDFGDIPRKGGDLVHEFTFTNGGTAPLVLLRAGITCSCLKASFPKRPVAPGDSGTIRVVYEPHKAEPGTFNKVIQIYSNSVGGRELLTVLGNSVEGERRVKVKNEKIKIK